MTQEKADIMYIRICQIIAEQSYAQRAKVGALIVKDNNILSFGFNGTPAGQENVCEEVAYKYVPGSNCVASNCDTYMHRCSCEGCNKAMKDAIGMHTKKTVLHAESNAFMKLCKSGSRGSDGATLYVTYSPCIECAKMAVQAGIKRVVYMTPYRCIEGLDLLHKCGIETSNVNIDTAENAFE
jgi:dCMP deaminase